MANDVPMDYPRIKTIIDAMNEQYNTNQNRVKSRYAEPMAQGGLDKLRALIQETNLGNQVSQLKMPYVVPREKADLSHIGAQTAGLNLSNQEKTIGMPFIKPRNEAELDKIRQEIERYKEETKYIPTKYAQAGQRLGIDERRYSPEMTNARLDYLKKLANPNAYSDSDANEVFDESGFPIKNSGPNQPNQMPNQGNMGSETDQGQQPNLLSQLFSNQGNAPQVNSGMGALKNSSTMNEDDQNNISQNQKSQPKNPMLNERGEQKREWKAIKMNVGKNKKVTRWEDQLTGDHLVALTPVSENRLQNQKMSIESVTPYFDRLITLGKKGILAAPHKYGNQFVMPNDAAEYNDVISKIKDKLLNASNFPKVKAVLNTLDNITSRQRGESAERYEQRVNKSKDDLNSDLERIDTWLSSGAMIIPSKSNKNNQSQNQNMSRPKSMSDDHVIEWIKQATPEERLAFKNSLKKG